MNFLVKPAADTDVSAIRVPGGKTVMHEEAPADSITLRAGAK
jgi:hypothetical protein